MRNRTEDQIVLALIRHGETEANAKRRYLGKTDDPLSARGRQLLLSYKEQHLYPKASYLFTSPMRRCLETAELLYPMQNPVIVPEWEETDFGCFEYKNYEELKDDPSYQQWMESGGTMAFPGGESRETFVNRCVTGFQKVCGMLLKAQADNPPERSTEPVRAAAIVHGGTIMALLSFYGEKAYFDYQTANGRGYLCRVICQNRNAVSRSGKGACAAFCMEEIGEL